MASFGCDRNGEDDMISLVDAKLRYPGAEVFSFGDTPTLIAELTALVRSGHKRATCISQAEIDAGEAAPCVGRRDIALGPDRAPALVIETVEVRATCFEDVTTEMALAEGEDDTLESWRANHRRYYERLLGHWAPDMPLIWERFDVVEDFEEDQVG
ncbi:MAG: ASCH domain-containing protein [Roseobacter sp.]